MRFIVLFHLVLCISRQCVDGLSSEETMEVTESCCSQGEAFAATAAALAQCADAAPPDDIEPKQLVACLAALRSCCQQQFQLKDECAAGMEFAPARRCSVPKSDVGKTCCEECSIGRWSGESQGAEACGGPADEFVSPATALRKNAYYKCCMEAVERPTSPEPPPTTPRPEPTTRRQRCAEASCDQLCSDEGGAPRCACRDGYRLQRDRRTCKDINECAEALDDLCTVEGTVCHNTPGSFKCVPIKKRDTTLTCPAGFKRNVQNQVCDDINECQSRRPPCPKYLCENTIGGYKCAGKAGVPYQETAPGVVTEPPGTTVKNDICPTGFRAGPSDECLDIDECSERLDDCQRLSQHCINTHGGFFCQDHVSKRCAPGFKVDQLTGVCEDIDECEESAEVCQRSEVCVNMPGAYTCKSKISTLPRLGTTKTCQEGTRMRPGGTGCEDIDECREGTHLCDQFQNCVNTYGGHECQCKNGFELDSSGSCVDIDECSLKLDNCREGQHCLNVVGTFTCTRRPHTAPTTSTAPAPPSYDYEYYDEEDNATIDNDTNRIETPTSQTTPPPPTLPTRPTPPNPTPRPTQPSRSHPMQPARTQPTQPSRTQPTQPSRNQPTQPSRSQPTEPSRTQPTQPSRTQPTQPSRTQPTQPSRTQPNTSTRNSTPITPTRPSYPSSITPRPTEPSRHNQPTYPTPRPTQPTRYQPTQPSPSTQRPTRLPYNPRTTTPRPYTNHPAPTRRPDPDPVSEVTVPTPVDPVTVEKERSPEGSYDVNTGDIPKDRWTNVIGKERTEPPSRENGFDPNQLHCLNGYERNDRGDCVDTNECEGNRHICSSAEVCENRPGGYVCACRPGHGRNGTGWCVPETATTRTTAVANPVTPPASERPSHPWEQPSYPMTCELGYMADPTTGRCVDIDECAMGRANCGAGEDCVNLAGGYRCRCDARCRERDSTPTDLRPSFVLPPSRTVSEPTVITVGAQYGQRGPRVLRPATSRLPHSGAVFAACPWGYRLTQDNTCLDIDECAKNVSECGPQQRCENFPGGYSCQCPAGHRLRGQDQCEDIDECQYGKPCPYNSECINTVGSYRCACGSGFRNAPTNDKVCVDVDECADSPAVCEQACANVWGGYRCYCHRGYRLNQDNRTCADVDECAEWGAVRLRGRLCGGQCVNAAGSYRCRCPAGYRLADDQRSCIDIDECSNGEATCAHAADEVCTNTRGGYHCHRVNCPRGYRLDNKHRCSRIQRSCPLGDWACLRQPSSYSYNFITFVSNIYLPEGSVDLFTMHGPSWSDSVVSFEMKMIDVQASPGVKPLDLSCFDMRPTNNICVVSLLCSPEGPQVAELELAMALQQRGHFAGSAVARLVVIVSQYDF